MFDNILDELNKNINSIGKNLESVFSRVTNQSESSLTTPAPQNTTSISHQFGFAEQENPRPKKLTFSDQVDTRYFKKNSPAQEILTSVSSSDERFDNSIDEDGITRFPDSSLQSQNLKTPRNVSRHSATEIIADSHMPLQRFQLYSPLQPTQLDISNYENLHGEINSEVLTSNPSSLGQSQNVSSLRRIYDRTSDFQVKEHSNQRQLSLDRRRAFPRSSVCEITQEPYATATYEQSVNIDSSQNTDNDSLKTLHHKFTSYQEKIDKIENKISELKEQLEQDLFKELYEEKSSCFEHCLSYLSVLKRKKGISQIEPRDQGADLYDDLYRKYCSQVSIKKYLAFAYVLKYIDVINTTRTSGSHKDLIRSIVVKNLDEAINFFIDFADKKDKYDLTLTPQQADDFLKICNCFYGLDRSYRRVFDAYQKISQDFTNQQKFQLLVDFFKKDDPGAMRTQFKKIQFENKLSELESNIIEAIDNPQNNSLTSEQILESCQLYFKFRGRGFDQNTLKIKRYYHNLKESQTTKSDHLSVKDLISKFEPSASNASQRHEPQVDNLQPEIDSDNEIQVPENILKKSFLENLTYKKSEFNYTQVRNQPRKDDLVPAMPALVIEASQVQANTKYPIGTEFYC